MLNSCIASRLSQLSAIVARGAVPKDTVRWVARPSDFAPFAERWRAVTSSARTAMFPADEQASFDEFYEIFARMDAESQLEQQAWTNLDIMERLDGPIDAETRLLLLKAIEQAQRSNKMFLVAGSYVVFQAQKVGIASNPKASPRAADIHSICLPLSTFPSRAERMLKG